MDAIWLGAFLACSFWFVQFVVDPRLLYQSLMPLFYWGGSFVEESARQPGGLLEYGSRFLEQFYSLDHAGAIIMAALMGATWFLGRLLAGLGASEPAKPSVPVAILQWLPPCLLLILSTAYDYSWMATALPVIAVLGATLLFARCESLSLSAGLALFCIISAALNHLAGLVSAALFAAVVGLPALFSPNRRARGALLLASGAGIGVAFFFAFHLKASALLPGRTFPGYLCLALYVSLLLLALVPAFRRPVQAAPEVAKDQKPARKRAGAETPPAPSLLASPALHAAVVSLAVLAGSFYSASLLVNKNRKAEVEVAFYAGRQQWDEVLVAARELQSYKWPIRLNTVLALYRKGRLLDDLLDFPYQKGDELVPTDYNEMLHSAATYAQTLLELGQVNLAEHWAHEALELTGDRPDVLQMLARINVLENRPQAAVAFVGFLRKNPFYRAWADDFLHRLSQDPKLQSDPLIAQYRVLKVTTDFAAYRPPTTTLLQQLLHTNPENRMAFEYLMAEYLLALKAPLIVQKLKSFQPGRELPRLINEAVVDYELQEQRAVHEAEGNGRYETRLRLKGFRDAINNFRNDPEAGRSAMAANFGNTYWYFTMYESTARTKPATSPKP